MSEPSKPAGDQGTSEPASGVARAWGTSGEQTLLGVAPPVALPPLPAKDEPPPPRPAPAPERQPSAGAIAGARMISVSDAVPTPATAAPAGAAFPAPAHAVSVPPQAPPQRPASIGGWQSAGPALGYQAPSLIETLTSVRSPLADAPPNIVEVPASAAEPAIAAPQQASAPEPAAPVAGAAVGGWQPVMHTVPIPIARGGSAPPAATPASPPAPELFTSTARSDDYLRAARDVVRAERDAAQAVAGAAVGGAPVSGAAVAGVGAAPAPSGDALANAATLQFEAVPPVRAPLSEQPPSASLPISVHVDSSWRRPEAAHASTLPLEAPRSTFPSWRVLVLVAISVLALIAIAAAAFVAVRRFSAAAPSGTTGSTPVQAGRALELTAAALPAPSLAGDDAELGARAARLVLLGRHDDARPLYAELARRDPSTPAYAALERILARARVDAR